MRRATVMMLPLLFGLGSFGCKGLPTASEDPSAEPPSLDFGDDLTEVGYGDTFHIDVRATNGPARAGEIRWTQLTGSPLQDEVIGENGFRFSARMPTLQEARGEPLPWGVVPISPRTRAEVVLQAEWSGAGGRAPTRRRIVVSAACRSRGLPNVPVDQRLYLGGSGWRLTSGPMGARASLEQRHEVTSLKPDVAGIFRLEDGDGRALQIQAGRYDDTPLDCGRLGCHSEIAAATLASPMASALTRRLGRRDDPDDPACALSCHATGEQGSHDGGFFDVARAMALPISLREIHDLRDLPRDLRRVGGVGCLACHGPGALPEADGRWSILRSDTCAYCHDAPPRYGHVAAWRASRMSHADQDREARTNRACAGCHTTWGFFANQEPASSASKPRVPPEGVGDLGIGCAVCHAVHAKAEPTRHLLREVTLPKLFDRVPPDARVRSGACLLCHAPGERDGLARASASAMWAGRGGKNPSTGGELAGPAPHLAVEGGCIGCHDAGPLGVERGRGHAFAASSSRCASCHAPKGASQASIRAEALDLWSHLAPPGQVPLAHDEPFARPIHAQDSGQIDRSTPIGRAAYDLSLVIEDRGAAAHNAPYARILLDAARKAIASARRPGPSGEARQ